MVVQSTFLDYIGFRGRKSNLNNDVILLSFEYRNKKFLNFNFSSIDFNELVFSMADENVCLNDVVNKTFDEQCYDTNV